VITVVNTCSIPMTTLKVFVMETTVVNSCSLPMTTPTVFGRVIAEEKTSNVHYHTNKYCKCCHRYVTGIPYSYHPNKYCKCCHRYVTGIP
jgi:hypothetical protein